MAQKLDYKEEIIYLDSLYMAEPSSIIEALQTLPAEVKRVLVVGHNPGMEGLAQILGGKVVDLPTAAMAEIKVPIKEWTELNYGVEGELVGLFRPEH